MELKVTLTVKRGQTLPNERKLLSAIKKALAEAVPEAKVGVVNEAPAVA